MPYDASATRTVETTRHLEAQPPEVIGAFLDHDDLQAWWHITRSLVEARPGGLWAIAWDGYGENETDHSWTGVIRRLDEGHLTIDPLVQNEPGRPILFGPLALEVIAEPADGGSRITVRHHGYQEGDDWDWLHEAVVEGWKHVLDEMADWFSCRS